MAFIRWFVQFDGEGDAANARPRDIGGHPAALLRGVCLRKDPHSPYANHDGYVPFGTLEDYAGGRSNGCTSWSPSDAWASHRDREGESDALRDHLDAADVAAVARAVTAGRCRARDRIGTLPV